LAIECMFSAKFVCKVKKASIPNIPLGLDRPTSTLFAEASNSILFHSQLPLQRYTITDLSFDYFRSHGYFQIPSNITYDEAATIPSVLTTAYVGLHNQNPYGLGIASAVTTPGARKYTGTPILVLGGASSLGQQGMRPDYCCSYNISKAEI
jgi:hypothetical protein